MNISSFGLKSLFLSHSVSHFLPFSIFLPIRPFFFSFLHHAWKEKREYYCIFDFRTIFWYKRRAGECIDAVEEGRTLIASPFCPPYLTQPVVLTLCRLSPSPPRPFSPLKRTLFAFTVALTHSMTLFFPPLPFKPSQTCIHTLTLLPREAIRPNRWSFRFKTGTGGEKEEQGGETEKYGRRWWGRWGGEDYKRLQRWCDFLKPFPQLEQPFLVCNNSAPPYVLHQLVWASSSLHKSRERIEHLLYLSSALRINCSVLSLLPQWLT